LYLIKKSPRLTIDDWRFLNWRLTIQNSEFRIQNLGLPDYSWPIHQTLNPEPRTLNPRCHSRIPFHDSRFPIPDWKFPFSLDLSPI
jgi:hypothetical protein